MVEIVKIYYKDGTEHSLAAIDARAALKHTEEWSSEKPAKKADKSEPKTPKKADKSDAPPIDNGFVEDGAEQFDEKTIEKNAGAKS